MGLGKQFVRAATLTALLAGCSDPFVRTSTSYPTPAPGAAPAAHMSRDAFEEATGARLYGDSAGIEFSADTMAAKAAEALLLRQRSGDVDEVYIHSPGDPLICDYDRPFDFGGLYCPYRSTDRIVIKAGQPAHLLDHELAHDDVRKAAAKDKTLLSRLQALASDSTGSLYLNEAERELYWDTLYSRIPAAKRDSAANFRLGFVELHGRVNIDEDAATFIVAAKRYDRNFADAVAGPEPVMPLRRRAQLWMEAGLLPGDYFEYKAIEAMAGSAPPGPSSSLDSLRAYDKAAYVFLTEHPQSEFRARVELQRGLIALAHGDTLGGAASFLNALQSSHEQQRVEFGIYDQILANLGRSFNALGNEYAGLAFGHAAQRYLALRATDPNIARTGVAPLLMRSGVVFCPAETLVRYGRCESADDISTQPEGTR